jgi:hypothetical protein
MIPPINDPSKLACGASLEGSHIAPTAPLWWSSKLAADPLSDKADWPLTARFDEHRPKCNNKFHHACASGEHKRPTAFGFPLPACALREHRSDVRILPLPFCVRVRRARGRSIALTPSFPCGRWASTRDQRAKSLFLSRAQGLTRLISLSSLPTVLSSNSFFDPSIHVVE